MPDRSDLNFPVFEKDKKKKLKDKDSNESKEIKDSADRENKWKNTKKIYANR